MRKVNGVVQLESLPYSDLETARINVCLARRGMYQAQGLAVELGTRENERELEAIVASAEARMAAEAEAAAKADGGQAPAPTGDATVVELRGTGPVEAHAAA